MLTIKLFLAESGSVATIDKDFPLYQGQFQNILLNVFVPLSTLAPDFALSTDSGQYDGINTPYVAGATVTVACQTVKRNGAIATSKAYNLRFVKNISKNGVGYALFERKLPKAFTNYAGVAPAGLTMICNVTNISYGQIDQSATTATSTKGAVTINFPILTKRIPAVSADYTFDYDTTETPASWYLNGRKVSLAYYGLSIAWTPQNQDTISLSVVADNPTTTSVLTTQTVKYDVFPSSDLDAEEPTDPTSTEVLEAQVNSITAKIVEMGDELDKKQNKSDSALETTAKDVVPAINELKGNIGGLDTRVTKNEQDIVDLWQEIRTGITYVGTMSYEGNDPPTYEQLNTFVEGTTGSPTRNGNLVIAVQKIPDATDIIYACIYSAARETWNIAPIPGIELASDNNAGLIQGGNSGDDKLYVKIVNGVIQDITANAVSGYPSVSVSNLGRMYTDIESIKNGETSVGLAEKAIKDAKGNTIDSYYMPNSIGATRNFVRKYALPVEFNDAMYVSANGLVKEVPTTPASGEQFVVNSSSTGYTTLFTVAYNLNNDGGTKFQLSKKNGYNADLFVKAAAYEEVQFVVDLTAGADPNGEGNTTLSTHVTLETPVATSLTDISIYSLLNELGDNIITLDGSKGNVYIVAKVSVFRTSSTAQTFTVVCNDMYRSAFHLSTAFHTVAINTGKVGELPQMIFTGYTVDGNYVRFSPTMQVPPDNSVIHVVLPPVATSDQGKTVLLDIGGESVNINTPNGANAIVSDLLNSTRNSSGYDFLMTYTVGMYYVQQGYETSVASVQFPSGERTVTYGTDNGLSISATGNVNYGVKTENPQMTVRVPIKAGAGVSMDADESGKFLVVNNADHDELAKKADKSYVDSAISGKQDTLVSGTNIKTINGESILGSGNIVIDFPYSKHYGARWNKTQAQMTRLYDAASFPTDITNFAHRGSVNPNYSNPFDSIYPWSGIRLCNIDLNLYANLAAGDSITKCVKAWEGDVDFSYEDENGVWRYRPEFYGKSWEDETYRYFDVSEMAIGSYTHYPEAIVGRWHGRAVTLMVGEAEKTCLVPSVGMPAKRIDMSTLHTYAKNYGATIDSIFSIDADVLLCIVEFATMDTQKAIGKGAALMYRQSSDLIAEDATNSNVVKVLASAASAFCIPGAIFDIGTSNGGAEVGSFIVVSVAQNAADAKYLDITLNESVTVTANNYWSVHGLANAADEEIGSKSGYIGTNSKCNSYYRGIVLFGNLWFYTLGAYENHEDKHIWIANSDEEADNYDALNTSVHTDTGLVLPGSGGYTKKLGMLPRSGLLSIPVFCTEIGGDSGNPVGDFFYNGTYSYNTSLIRGGYTGSESGIGALCNGWYGGPSSSSWPYAARPRLKNP